MLKFVNNPIFVHNFKVITKLNVFEKCSREKKMAGR